MLGVVADTANIVRILVEMCGYKDCFVNDINVQLKKREIKRKRNLKNKNLIVLSYFAKCIHLV